MPCHVGTDRRAGNIFLGEHSLKIAAIFDLDGTILDISSEKAFFTYLFLRGALSFKDFLAWVGYFFKTAWVADFAKALNANKMYLRNKPCAKIREFALNCFSEKLEYHISKYAIEEIERHRSQGHHLILLSGTLDLLLEHFMRYLNMDSRIGTPIETRDGVFTGHVIGLHPFGQAKAVITRQIAEQYEIDLSQSYGYANSFSDVPFLDTVGHAIAVNPDNRLARHAQQRGWEIADFAK